MSQPLPTSMFDVSFQLASASYGINVTSDTYPTGTNLAMAQAANSWFRVYLANSSSADGTEANPYQLLGALSASLAVDPLFTLGMSTAGYVTIRYTGTSQTGSLTFSSPSNPLPFILGFTSSHIQVAKGATLTAQYQPFFSVFSFCKANDSNWTVRQGLGAFAQMPNGTVYGWANTFNLVSRTFNFRFHPFDQAQKSAYGSNATMAMPISRSQWVQPVVTPDAAGFVYGYSMAHFFFGAKGRRIGAKVTGLQSLISGADTTFDVVCLTPKTINAPDIFRPTIPSFDQLEDFDGVEVSFVGTDTKAGV